MSIEQALLKLNQAGLIAELVEGFEQRIIGGISKSEELGFSIYKNSFAIYRQDNDWMVTVVGPGQMDTTKKVKTLADAVNETCMIYQNKGQTVIRNS